MDDVPFAIYNEGVGWSNHVVDAKSEMNVFSNCSSYVNSSSGGEEFTRNYSGYQNVSQSFNQPASYASSHIPQEDIYNSPSSYYSVLDSQTMDDFESITRERCHTWPRIQQRPPTSFGGNQQQQSHIDDGNQHQFSPPPLPSRGSSGLSLISESNESLLATPTSAETRADIRDWTSDGRTITAYSTCSYGNQRPQTVNQTSLTMSTPSPVTATANSNKRSGAAAPSYKSGHPSYVELITQAITSSPEKRMTLSEIYDWMVANVPSFKDQRHLHSSAGWKNSVRHNLSLHARFKRVKRNGMDKPSWWTVDMSEEAKRERSKRPRQSRPRANTTTAASREYQTQREQHNHRPAPIQGQGRPSLGFTQPHIPSHSDHASSGRGSLSFSGSLTPASSVGSDIFVVGTATATNAQMNPGYFNFHHQQSSVLQESTVLAPVAKLEAPSQYAAMDFDGTLMEESEWDNQNGCYSMSPMTSILPVNDQQMTGITNVAESTNLHCLSHAITVSLQDPAGPATTDCSKTDGALNLNTSLGPNSDSGYYGSPNGGNVSNLVHALRQNTLEETTGPSLTMPRQMLHTQTTGDICEIASPSRLSPYVSPGAYHPHQQQSYFQGLSTASSPQQLSPIYGSQTPQQLNNAQRQFSSPSYPPMVSLKKNRMSVATSQLPDDLAALDVGGLDCNIMDVLSYEMNCNGTGNATGFV